MELNFVKREVITYGWSGDRKYRVSDSHSREYMLRISPTEKLLRRKNMFEMMLRAWALNVPMCQPIEFGECQEGVYLLQGWVEGEDAEKLLPTMSREEQYLLGFDAGKILRRLHSFPAPESLEPWEIRFNRKIDRKLAQYNECQLKHDRGEAFVRYIEEHRLLLGGRPQCWQHGDYHVGNMVIDSDARLHIIDFDRDDYGDPWEEFNRIVWSAQRLPEFSSGMIDGYFGGKVPCEFWCLLALYIAVNAISSLPWAIPFGQREIEVMLAQGQEILSWYDDMQRVVPRWYTGVVR